MGVYNGPFQIHIAMKLMGYLNILQVELFAILLAIEHTRSLNMDAFIFTNNLNNIYIPLNHIKHCSSEYNHPNKLLIAQIIATIKSSKHDITIHKARAHTNIVGNNKVDKLTKRRAQKPNILVTPSPIGH